MTILSLVRGTIERNGDVGELDQLIDELSDEDSSLRSELVAGLAAAKPVQTAV